MKICYFTVLFGFFLQFNAVAQLFDDKNFLHKVKQIDEFIDRFNNSENAFEGYASISKKSKANIDNFYKTLYGVESVDRISMLLGLFNYEQVERIGRDKIKKFVVETTDSTKNNKLSFYDDNWFAEVSVNVTYKGRKQKMTMILKNEYPEVNKEVSSWAVVAGKASFLNGSNSNKERRGVNAGAHGVNFIPLISALEDNENLDNLVSKDFVNDELSVILYAIRNGDIEVNNIKEIKYHFLQLNDWIFTVDYFSRNTPNSGWLISDLIAADSTQKLVYKSQILNSR